MRIERDHPNMLYFSEHPKGGHFAAWEQPAMLTDDIRETFKTLRT